MERESCKNKRTALTVDDVISFITAGDNREIFLYGAYPISKYDDVQKFRGYSCAIVRWSRPSFDDAKLIIECEFDNVDVSLKDYGSGNSALRICVKE